MVGKLLQPEKHTAQNRTTDHSTRTAVITAAYLE
jgi:hypothetical protein